MLESHLESNKYEGDANDDLEVFHKDFFQLFMTSSAPRGQFHHVLIDKRKLVKVELFRKKSIAIKSDNKCPLIYPICYF